MKKLFKYFVISFIALIAITIIYNLINPESPQQKLERKAVAVMDAIDKVNDQKSFDAFMQLFESLQASDSAKQFQQLYDSINIELPQLKQYVAGIELGKQQKAGFYIAQEFIKQNLKAPTTALFESYQSAHKLYYADTDVFHYRIAVDAQNSFGAMIRSTFEVDLKLVGDEWLLVGLKEV